MKRKEEERKENEKKGGNGGFFLREERRTKCRNIRIRRCVLPCDCWSPPPPTHLSFNCGNCLSCCSTLIHVSNHLVFLPARTPPPLDSICAQHAQLAPAGSSNYSPTPIPPASITALDQKHPPPRPLFIFRKLGLGRNKIIQKSFRG